MDHTLIILSSPPYMHNYVWSDNWYWGTGIQNNVDRKHTQGLVMYMYVQAPMSMYNHATNKHYMCYVHA